MVIPQVIHQLWVGPDPEPTHWTDTWRDLCETDGWTHKMWTEDNLGSLPMQNQDLFDYYIEAGAYSGAYNVFHGEVLYQIGGWAVGADIELTDPEGFLAHEMHQTRFTTSHNELRPHRLFSNVVGSVAGHPILAEFRNILAEQWERGDVWPPYKTTGAGQLTTALRRWVYLTPMRTFANTYFDVEIPGDDASLGESHMYTTKKLQAGELSPELERLYYQ